MPIAFRSKLSSSVANQTFLDKTINDIKKGVLGLYKVTIGEPGSINDVQDYINKIATTTGISGESDALDTTYSSTEFISNGDDRKVAIGKLDAQARVNADGIQDILDSVGQPDGIASLDSGGKVPASQLPSFVDDVLEFPDFASFPLVGETGKIYIALDTNKAYRWTGTVYFEISASAVDSVNGQTGIVVLTKSDVGLGNVTNDAQLIRAAGDINSFTEKLVPVDADVILIEDSADSFNKKRVKLENLLAGGGGGGGGSVAWEKLGDLSPRDNSQDGIKLEGFGSIDSQEIFVTLNVPATYSAGNPITMTGGAFFAVATSGQVFFKAQTALIRAASTVLGTYSNIHTSTNSAVVVDAVSNRLNLTGTIQLSDATGQINGVAVAAGDKLRVRLFRDLASESPSASGFANLMINNFSVSFE